MGVERPYQPQEELNYEDVRLLRNLAAIIFQKPQHKFEVLGYVEQQCIPGTEGRLLYLLRPKERPPLGVGFQVEYVDFDINTPDAVRCVRNYAFALTPRIERASTLSSEALVDTRLHNPDALLVDFQESGGLLTPVVNREYPGPVYGTYAIGGGEGQPVSTEAYVQVFRHLREIAGK